MAKPRSKSSSSSTKERKRKEPLFSSSEDQQKRDNQLKEEIVPVFEDNLSETFSDKDTSKRNTEKRNRKKKGRKRKTQDERQNLSRQVKKDAGNASSISQQHEDRNEDPLDVCTGRAERKKGTKEKRKKRKRKEEDLAPSVDSNNGVMIDNGEDDDPDVLLEGSMISDMLILIDRKRRKVYSATEQRLENGERKEVGHLDADGHVVLFRTNEEADNGVEKVDNNGSTDEDPSLDFPYEVDPDDHCESPIGAYEDIVPLLQSYARRLFNETNEKLSIYDPYFCNGRVARHLESLGFPEVYNRKEDCYEVWKDSSRYPSYDIFLTNPPYSGDHIEKLMQHVTRKQNKNKPWMLLMPIFVHKKDFFQRLTADAGQLPIYLVPKKRYVYQPPPNMRAKKVSSTHKKSSPFVSMWYLWGGSRDVTDKWYSILQQRQADNFDLARSKSALRDLRRKQKKK